MLAFRFCSLVLRWRRVVFSLCSSSCAFDAFVGYLLRFFSSPLFLLGRVVFACCFVRFPCPARRPAGAPSLWWLSPARRSLFGWRCVSSSALSSLFRSGRWVWAVRPAVVCRRSGVVLFFWVWLSPSP